LLTAKRLAHLNRNRFVEKDSHATTSCSIRS
jgi:hypothetical protein